MIIIKIIILYFIEITHTDGFPSTGTRLVMFNSLYMCISRFLATFQLFLSNIVNVAYVDNFNLIT